MALTPLATVEDLARRAGEEIVEYDYRAGSVLSMASALVRAYVGRDFEEGEIPEGAVVVTVDVAYRVWTNPDGLVGDGIDDVNRRWSEQTASEGFYLTKANKLILDSLRTQTANRGLWTLGVEKGDEYDNTVYVPTGPPPAGYPFPWYAGDDPLIQ